MIRVKEILDRKKRPDNLVKPSDLVIDALNMLTSVNLSYLVVMDGKEYKGIFCERDYTRNVILKGRSSRTATVQEVMTVDLPMVQITDTVEHCMNVMNLHKARYLLAYNDQHFEGVITIHDLLRQVIFNKQAVFDSMAVDKLIDREEGEKIY